MEPRTHQPSSKKGKANTVEWVSRGECGRRLGITAQRISQLCHAGMPTRPQDKQVPWPAARDWYEANVTRARSGNPKYRQRPERVNVKGKGKTTGKPTVTAGMGKVTTSVSVQDSVAEGAADPMVEGVDDGSTEPSSRVTKRHGETLVEAQLRKEQALADLRQLEVWEKRGLVVPVGIINAFMAAQIMKARQILTRIGPELQDRLAVETEPANCQTLIDREVQHALGGLALHGEKWIGLFDGHSPRAEEMRKLVGRMVEIVDG